MADESKEDLGTQRVFAEIAEQTNDTIPDSNSLTPVDFNGGEPSFRAKSFLPVKKCNKWCPYYSRGCSWIEASKTQFDNLCAVKQLSPKSRMRVLRFLEGTENALLINILETVQELEPQIKLARNPALTMQYLDRLMKLYSMKYSTKSIADIQINNQTNVMSASELLDYTRKYVQENMKMKQQELVIQEGEIINDSDNDSNKDI